MTRGNSIGFGSAAVWIFYAGGDFLKFIRYLAKSINVHRLNCAETGINRFCDYWMKGVYS
jgi:hypothetical protein